MCGILRQRVPTLSAGCGPEGTVERAGSEGHPGRFRFLRMCGMLCGEELSSDCRPE